MKNWSKILIGIAASLAVSLLIASGIFWILQGMNREAARGRVYDQIINKTHALNQLSAKYEGEPDKGYIHQITEVHKSLGNLLAKLTSVDSSEGLLIRQIRASNEDLGYSLNRLIAASADKGGIQAERKNVLTSRLWLKTQFILDDTYRLVELSNSRIESAQVQTGTLVILLVLLLIFINAAISFFSARSTVRAEAETRKQREWLNVTLSSIGDAVIATDTSGRVSFINPVAAGLTGWSEDEAWGKPADQVFRVIDEKTREPGSDIFKTVLDDGQIITLSNNTALVARDGREIPIEDSAAPIRDETGQPIGVVLVFHDVTEKRRTQEALRESERRLVGVLESMPDAFVSFDADMRYTYVNANAERLQATRREELLGKDARIVYQDAESYKTISQYERVIIEQKPVTSASYHAGFDRWVEIRAFPTPDGVSVFYKDVSAQVKAEEALRESEARLRRIAHAGRIGFFEWNAAKDTAYWSPEHYELFGIEPGSPVSWEPWLQGVHPEDRERVVKNAARLLERGRSEGQVRGHKDDYRFIRADGSTVWLESDTSVDMVSGEPIIRGLVRDITERKQTEMELRASEAKYRSLFEHMLDGFAYCQMLFDEQGHPEDFVYLAVNESFGRLTGLMDVTGKRVTQVIAGIKELNPELFEIYGRVASTGVPERFEIDFKPLDLTLSISVYSPESGYFVAVFDDITERKRGEEALRENEARMRASLTEKEVLLNEIHHRVKNNMQVISSLVDLQADELEDSSMREVLKDVTHRVRSMALVHEKLYQSADLARVEFAQYTESLLNYLLRAHGTVASSVRLSLDLEPVFLPVSTAVPCGLILNELVNNALKHAFRGRDDGVVCVLLRGGEESRVSLCVRDNGAGLPVGFDWMQARSLGLRLVQMLARQLRASVEVKSSEGTAFSIEFKGPKK